MTPRDYQHEDLTLSAAAYNAGERRILGTWPTGAGKSEYLALLPQYLGMKPGEQMLAIVDRKELVRQNAEKIQLRNPGLRVDIERANTYADPDADIIVASAQTMGKADIAGSDQPSERLKRFDTQRVKIIAIDETHTTPKSEEYARVLKHFGCYKPLPEFNRNRNIFLDGVTATPNRTDGIGLENIFDRMAFQRTLKDPTRTGLMETGLTVDGVLRPWLCDILALAISTETDISDIRTVDGDFARGQLEKRINTPARNRLIVDAYLEHARGRQFFAFTVDVQHSKDLTKAFTDRGLKVASMDGKTSDGDRKKLFDLYRAGYLDGLVSCGVLSVGVDLPMVECLLMCRPTASALLFRQQVGRGLRPWPSPEFLMQCFREKRNPGRIKPNVLVLDFIDATRKHRLLTVPTLFGLRGDFNMKGGSVLEVIEQIEQIRVKAPSLKLDTFTDLRTLKGVAEKIDLFAVPVVPSEIASWSSFPWIKGVIPGTYQLSLPDDGGLMTVRENALGECEVSRQINGVRTTLAVAPTLAGAVQFADRTVPREAIVVLKSDAKWRTMRPTDAQIGLLQSLYPELRRPFKSDTEFSAMVSARYTKGEASTMISQRYKRSA